MDYCSPNRCNSSRSIGNAFGYLPKTTSKEYLIRLFYFMFSVLLYNLWILADILIWLALFGHVGEDHLVTSKLFGTILYTVDLEGG